METEEKHGREIERFSLVILVFAFLLILLYFLLISFHSTPSLFA